MGNLIKAHIQCNDCGSSDALSIYEDDEGNQYSKCFSCGKGRQLKGVENKPDDDEYEGPIHNGTFKPIPSRDITIETAKHYGVTVEAGVAKFPYPTGAKLRSLTEKKFWSEAGAKPVGLFGQDRFAAGGRFVTITEGEFDAMAGYQMFGNKYPFVSVRNAESALNDCKEAFEWIDSFDNIVVCFDNDEPGKKAAAKVAELLGSKVKIVKLTKHKDANAYLMEGKTKEFVDEWWKAEQFVPDGIIAGTNMWELVNKPKKLASVLYPFEALNGLTYGIRPAELVTITAGSGLGKSQFLREVVWQILNKTSDNIGLMFLEESPEKTGVSLMSLAANKPLHLPTTEYTVEEYQDAFKSTLGTGRVYLFDHFGSTSIDNIVNRVRYMAKALDCKYIVLDHLSIVVSSQESGDERKALDEIMTRLRMLVQETGISLIAVSHLKRPEGKGHEEGAATSLAQLRGSASIAQLSDIVIGLERNGQADDEETRNTTKIRVLKNRFSGETGPAGEALYSKVTGRMLEKTEEAL